MLLSGEVTSFPVISKCATYKHMGWSYRQKTNLKLNGKLVSRLRATIALAKPRQGVLSKLGMVFWDCLWVGPLGCSWSVTAVTALGLRTSGTLRKSWDPVSRLFLQERPAGSGLPCTAQYFEQRDSSALSALLCLWGFIKCLFLSSLLYKYTCVLLKF